MINKTRMKLIEQVAKSSIYPELQGTFKRGKNCIVTNGISVLFFKEKPDLPIVKGYEIINPNMGEKTKQEEI